MTDHDQLVVVDRDQVGGGVELDVVRVEVGPPARPHRGERHLVEVHRALPRGGVAAEVRGVPDRDLARHRAVDLLRSELRRVARQERHYRLTPAEPPGTASDEVMAAETASVVRAAVQLLPDGQRRVVELAYFEGLTCREVASAMGIPEGTAKSRLRLAMAKLETVLDRQLLEST